MMWTCCTSEQKQKQLQAMPHLVPEDLQKRRNKKKKKIANAECAQKPVTSSANLQYKSPTIEALRSQADVLPAPRFHNHPSANGTKPKKYDEVGPDSGDVPNPYLDEFRKFQNAAPDDIDKIFHPSLPEDRREQLLDLLDLGLIEKFAWAIPTKATCFGYAFVSSLIV